MKPDSSGVRGNNASASCIDDKTSSPVKIDLDYLNEQRIIISNAVDNATDCLNKDGPSYDERNVGPTRQQTLRSCRSSATSKTVSSEAKRPLVSVPHLKVLKTTGRVNVGIKTNSSTPNPVFKVSSCNSEPFSTNVCNDAGKSEKNALEDLQAIKLTPIERSDQQVIHIKPPVVQGHKSKAVKVLINPSSAASARFSVCTAQEKQKETIIGPKPPKLFKVKLTGQSTLIKPSLLSNKQNFVKLDLNNLSKLDASTSTSSVFKRMPKSKPFARHNSSVVTNLVTRLEEQGCRSVDDSVLPRRSAFDEATISAPLKLIKVGDFKAIVDKLRLVRYFLLPQQCLFCKHVEDFMRRKFFYF